MGRCRAGDGKGEPRGVEGVGGGLGVERAPARACVRVQRDLAVIVVVVTI